MIFNIDFGDDSDPLVAAHWIGSWLDVPAARFFTPQHVHPPLVTRAIHLYHL